MKDALWLPWSRWMYLEIRSGQGNCVVEFFLLREFESLIIYQLFSDDYNPNTYTFFRYPLLPRKSLYLFSPLMYGIFTPALQHFLFFFPQHPKQSHTMRHNYNAIFLAAFLTWSGVLCSTVLATTEGQETPLALPVAEQTQPTTAIQGGVGGGRSRGPYPKRTWHQE